MTPSSAPVSEIWRRPRSLMMSSALPSPAHIAWNTSLPSLPESEPSRRRASSKPRSPALTRLPAMSSPSRLSAAASSPLVQRAASSMSPQALPAASK